MKVLWVSNVIFPEVCQELQMAVPTVGGWMQSGAFALLKANPDISLTVVALYKGPKVININKYKIDYFLVPDLGGNQVYDSQIEGYFKEINNIKIPDIVHIHGSEYPHSLAWVRACGSSNVTVSIQGLVSVYAEFFLGGIPVNEIKGFRTIRDIFRNDSLLQQQKRMRSRGEYEKELLKKCEHIIGRTTWDKSNLWAINPKARYHFCNETLRSGFYVNQWEFRKCTRFSIFLSQAHYPIKGLHQVLNALPIILRHFPETKILIAGSEFVNASALKRNGYASLILSIIKKNNLEENIQFVGKLDEKDMIQMYLKANVFVCPSSIENSPNSIGEAQLLGTPCVASYVGGSMDMITDGVSGFLYRYEEIALLASRICEIFSDQKLAETLSNNGRLVSASRHDAQTNSLRLSMIYKQMLNEITSNI
jgi:glycosyltransferase involved in cell wall biosynthesis